VYSGRLKVTFKICDFILIKLWYATHNNTFMIINTILVVYVVAFFSLCLCLLGVGGVGKRIV